MSGSLVRISVVYALPDRQPMVELSVPEGTTVAAAVEISGLSRRYPEIAQRPLECAIYSRVVPLSQRVCAGDRIEILRPLAIDPKEARRQRSRKQASG